MEKYLVVIEKADNDFSAFSPDLPGCITVGYTFDDTISSMKEAIEVYLEALIEKGEPVPVTKGLKYHLEDGVFEKGKIAEEYFIAQVEVHAPNIAA